MTTEAEATGPAANCDCEKCCCPICGNLQEGERPCCAHGCLCCGHQRDADEAKCACEDDCGCTADSCNCGHGPCVCDTGCCACGCGGHGAHVCPVCKMTMTDKGVCACVHPRCRCDREHLEMPCGCPRNLGGLSTPVKAGLAVASLSDLVLKATAIRRALKLGDKRWVLPLAIVNTAGILPAFYLASHRDCPTDPQDPSK